MVKPMGIVLAGGRSSRMGRPKALLDLGNRRLIEYPLAALTGAGLEVAVVAKPKMGLDGIDVTVWEEPAEPTHPALGLVAALERAGRPIVALACDMPFVTVELVRQLASADERCAVAQTDGRLQPLCARYGTSSLDELRHCVSDQSSLIDTVAGLDPLVIEQPEKLLFNVNTPADLQQAERLLEQA